jgi:hypothetical protein
MKKYEGVEIELHMFLTSVADGGEWSYSRTGHFTLRKGAVGTGTLGGGETKAGLIVAQERKISAATEGRTHLPRLVIIFTEV